MSVTGAFTLTLDRSPDDGTRSSRIAESAGIAFGMSTDRSAIVGVLGTTGREAEASALANDYVRGGRMATVCARGPIGSVVLDQPAGIATLVAAPIGLRQIYWSADDRSLRVSSSPNGVASAPGQGLSFRPAVLFDYLYFHMIPGPTTAFSGIAKLEGGHALRWDESGTAVSRYWYPRFEDARAPPEAEAARELMRLLHEAVERNLGSNASAGAFLSGGLDSSTVAGLASRTRGGLPTVSMGFHADGYDEMAYARIAARHFGTTSFEYYVTPDDVLRTLPAVAAAFPEPFGNSSAAAVYHCARIARERGLELLLAGDGGDELFGGNERYARQLVFEQYGRVPRSLRSSLFEPLVTAVAGVTHSFPFGKALSYIHQAKVPLPDRLQTYNFLHRHDPGEIFAPRLLEQMDSESPLHLLREEFSVPLTSAALNRMLFLDWKFTLHDNDLVKVNTMCDHAGVDVAYPMLDQHVVDFSLRLPASWKVRNGQLRWFYKRAMRNFLPREIIAKSKHGFGLPFGVWTRSHDGLRRLSEDALGSLALRGYFRPEFLIEALRLHRDGHASYHGELVWILMVLELWLRVHSPTARM